MVSQEGELLTAVQLQFEAEAPTSTPPVPPADVAVAPLAPSWNEQVTPGCIIGVV
jgi:hypothetical protein